MEILVIIECQMPLSELKPLWSKLLNKFWHSSFVPADIAKLSIIYLEQTKRACVAVFFRLLSWKPLLMSPVWATQLFPSNSLLMFLSAFAPKSFLALVSRSLSIVQGGLRWSATHSSKTRTHQGVIRMFSYQGDKSGCYLIRVLSHLIRELSGCYLISEL